MSCQAKGQQHHLSPISPISFYDDHCPLPHNWLLLYWLRSARLSRTQPDIIEGSNASVPIFRGVGDEEEEGWGVPAMPQDDVQDEGAMQRRTTLTPVQELSSHEHFLGEQQWSSSAAAHDAVSTRGDGAGGHHDTGSTHGERLELWDSP